MDEAKVVAGGAEDGIDVVPEAHLETVLPEITMGFEVPDDGFGG